MSAGLAMQSFAPAPFEPRLHLGLPALFSGDPDMSDLDYNDTPLILEACRAEGATRAQAAYICATAYWETNRQMKPVEEAYWLSQDWRRKNLRYFPWHGRGYVQLTWERNYVFAGQELGLDLTTDPAAVMEPKTAALILVRGSLHGWFTGRKLTEFVGLGRCDFKEARRVINGTDKASAIAALAHEYDAALLADGYGGATHLVSDRPVLKIGASGVAVAELQTDLADLGYFSGRLDGHFGKLTRAALLAFQADLGLDTDGVAGPVVWSALSEAEPRAPRDIDLAEIDQNSGIAADARMSERVGDFMGLGGVAALGTQINAASDALGSASGLLDRLSLVITQNWPVVALCGACFLGWLALRALGYSTRQRRLRDAREHRSLAR